jgi:hypothetical protein
VKQGVTAIKGKTLAAEAGRTEVRMESAARNDFFGTAEAVPLTRPRTAVGFILNITRFTRDGPATAHLQYAMAVESFPAGRRSQAERPRNSERRPAIGNQCLALFARRTSDGGSDQRERGAKPRVEAALPHQ